MCAQQAFTCLKPMVEIPEKCGKLCLHDFLNNKTMFLFEPQFF